MPRETRVESVQPPIPTPSLTLLSNVLASREMVPCHESLIGKYTFVTYMFWQVFDMNQAQDQGFRKAFKDIAIQCRNLNVEGWNTLTDAQIDMAAEMSRNGCLIHYKRNVERLVANREIVPKEKAKLVHDTLLELVYITNRDEWLEKLDMIHRECPGIYYFSRWYLRKTARSMIFLIWRTEAADRILAPTNTNAVEGRNSINKAVLKGKSFTDAMEYFIGDLVNAWKRIECCHSESIFILNVCAYSRLICRWRHATIW